MNKNGSLVGCDSVVQHEKRVNKTYWKIYLSMHTFNCSSRMDFLVLILSKHFVSSTDNLFYFFKRQNFICLSNERHLKAHTLVSSKLGNNDALQHEQRVLNIL